MTIDELKRLPLSELPDGLTRYLLERPVGQVLELLEELESRFAAREVLSAPRTARGPIVRPTTKLLEKVER